jgi:Ca2+-binding EF-hand superfamily protein
LSKQNLAAAFALFDKDGSGTISAAEIRRVLEGGSMMDDHVWNELVQQVDQNGDGEVDLKEFEELLLAKI